MKQQILDLVQRWAQAELDGDVAAYDRLLTPDFVGIGPVGFALDAQQWAGRHRGDLTNHEFEIEEPEVRVHGDAAIVNGVQRQRTTARGHDTSGAFRLTLIAVRHGDAWAIANIQLSGPLRSPTALPPFPRDTISRTDLQEAIEAGTVTTVDALPAPAYERRHLPTALNLTIEDAPQAAPTILPDPTAPIVVYSTDTSCTRGPELKRLGYQNVRLYGEGIEDWITAGLPVEP